VIACAALARAAAAARPTARRAAAPATPPRIALWVLLSACAVVLLMGITNHLCLDVASVPFLWIVPLAIYLATLIVCFGAPRVYRRIPFALLAAAAYRAERSSQARLGATRGCRVRRLRPVHVAVRLLLLRACMVLHGELYRLRPPARSLTAFYLCTSGGGALGGLAVGLVAPRVFDGFYELPIGLALACVLLLAACRDDVRGSSRAARRPGAGRWSCRGRDGARLCGHADVPAPAYVLHQERSFFGVLRVESESRTPPRRALLHGTTQHGSQVIGSETSPPRTTDPHRHRHRARAARAGDARPRSA
jgi:hypothetical protein